MCEESLDQPRPRMYNIARYSGPKAVGLNPFYVFHLMFSACSVQVKKFFVAYMPTGG